MDTFGDGIGGQNLKLKVIKRDWPCKKCGGEYNNARGYCRVCASKHRIAYSAKSSISEDKRAAIEAHQERSNEYKEWDIEG